jgi:Gluconate 2-dehydrogenase subunit 3
MISCMKRRGFVKTLIALPVAPALAAQQPQQQQPASSQTPVVQPPAGGRGGRFGQGTIPKFELTPAEVVGEPAQRFFTPPQFAALRKLSDVLMPPMRGLPGALDCGAPEFLDFLIGSSPADRQALYRHGLDMLHARAKGQFNKSFAELDATQADAVIRPLLAPVPWAYDLPKDAGMRFLAEAHRDIRTATQNSREWAAAGAASGRRGGGFGGGGSYLNPIDPLYKG